MIDRGQNHLLAGSRVQGHDLKHDHADETQQAWAKLGAAIEAALARRPTLGFGLAARQRPAPIPSGGEDTGRRPCARLSLI